MPPLYRLFSSLLSAPSPSPLLLFLRCSFSPPLPLFLYSSPSPPLLLLVGTTLPAPVVVKIRAKHLQPQQSAPRLRSFSRRPLLHLRSLTFTNGSSFQTSCFFHRNDIFNRFQQFFSSSVTVAIIMGKFKRVLVLEVECAKDKNPETPGGKYRRDTPWLVESFKKKGVESDILFITSKDTAATLQATYPDTAFLGRVNPMDYPTITLNEYITILKDLKKAGLLLGPEADHMDRLGSKMILYELRDSSMGIEGTILHPFDDLKKNEGEIDRILPPGGPPRVLKMMRGSTGLGVWKLENKGDRILMTDAYTQTTEELGRKEVIPKFLALCQEDAISMPFLPLIKDGEFRFLMSKHAILEVVHKRPIDENSFTATLRSGAVYTILKLEEHQAMVDNLIKWSHQLKTMLKLDDVPYWWSVDCIEEAMPNGLKPGQIPSSTPGRRLVLSEINCSCLGLVADTSEEAKAKGLKFSDMIAEICLA